MSLNNPHKTKKSTRVGLRNIRTGLDQAGRTLIAERRFANKTGGLGFLAACDYLGEEIPNNYKKKKLEEINQIKLNDPRRFIRLMRFFLAIL